MTHCADGRYPSSIRQSCARKAQETPSVPRGVLGERIARYVSAVHRRNTPFISARGYFRDVNVSPNAFTLRVLLRVVNAPLDVFMHQGGSPVQAIWGTRRRKCKFLS